MTWYSLFSQVVPVDLLLHPKVATSNGITLKATSQPFPNSMNRNEIGVLRKALLSTTAKYSILQDNFQLYSLEHRQTSATPSGSGRRQLPTRTATEALRHTCSSLRGADALVLFSSSTF